MLNRTQHTTLPLSVLDSLREPDDVLLEDEAGKDDIVILFVGPSDAGKSTVRFDHSYIPVSTQQLKCPIQFIKNVLLGLNYTRNDRLSAQSRPDRIIHHKIQLTELTNRRSVLVDSPGLDGSVIGDPYEILRRLSVWLASLHRAQLKVAGVVYMYPIYPNRLTRNDAIGFEVFRKLCGTQSLIRVIALTTKWDLCPTLEIGDHREQETWKLLWKGLKGNFTALRVGSCIDSALSALHAIVENCIDASAHHYVLTIQEELVLQGKAFEKTDAARELRAALDGEHPRTVSRFFYYFVSMSRSVSYFLPVISHNIHQMGGNCIWSSDKDDEPKSNRFIKRPAKPTLIGTVPPSSE
ncbi:hypothetical protein H1R20_g8925, partial [Candolleomyces eurysporus]